MMENSTLPEQYITTGSADLTESDLSRAAMSINAQVDGEVWRLNYDGTSRWSPAIQYEKYYSHGWKTLGQKIIALPYPKRRRAKRIPKEYLEKKCSHGDENDAVFWCVDCNAPLCALHAKREVNLILCHLCNKIRYG